MINGFKKNWSKYGSLDELRGMYIGARSGRLTVIDVFIRQEGNPIKNVTYAKCQCDCGNIVDRELSLILRNVIVSCGCYREERRVISKSPNEYYINSDGTVSVVAANDPNTIFTVDLCTWVWFSHLRWFLGKTGYMTTSLNRGGPYKYHMLLYPVPPGTDYVRDHRNRCRLDNRYCNLRVVHQRDNSCNVSKKQNLTTNIKGVYINEYGKYIAILNSKKHGVRLNKPFNTLEEAAMQRREWEEMYQTIEELIVPPLILPNGQLNVYNFPFSWYPDKYCLIWANLGLRIAPYALNQSDYIAIANRVYRGDYNN